MRTFYIFKEIILCGALVKLKILHSVPISMYNTCTHTGVMPIPDLMLKIIYNNISNLIGTTIPNTNLYNFRNLYYKAYEFTIYLCVRYTIRTYMRSMHLYIYIYIYHLILYCIPIIIFNCNVNEMYNCKHA